MSYRYPYGNTEQMNLDWFLNQWEKFKADWAEAEAGIDGSLDAEIAKVEAAMSELYAARDAAAASATAARQSSLDAAAAQVAAGNSKTAAQAAETAARGSQTAAAQSAQEAQASAQGAENSALTASQAANTATQQAAGADAAKGAAEAAQQAAEDAQAAAAQSARQAGQSATAAADHANDAADSATVAQQAAQDMSDSVAQITTNKNDISDLKESISEIESAIDAGLEQKTITNVAMASFDDGAEDALIKKARFKITPRQSGDRTPSIENERAIIPWDAIHLNRTGKNMFSPVEILNAYFGYTAATNRASIVRDGTGNNKLAVIECAPNTTYTYSFTRIVIGGTDDFSITAFSTPPIIGSYGQRLIFAGTTSGNRTPFTFTTPADAHFLVIRIGNATTTNIDQTLATAQLEIGSVMTEYVEPVTETYDVTLPTGTGDIYGGVIDINEDGSGTLTINQKLASAPLGAISKPSSGNNTDGTGSLFYYTRTNTNQAEGGMLSNKLAYVSAGAWEAMPASSMLIAGNFVVFCSNIPDQTIADFTAWFADNNINYTYYLKNPETYTLTAEQVKTLRGINNIWANSGGIELLTYRAMNNTSAQIMLVKAIIAHVLDSMVADTALSINDFRIVNNTLYRVTAPIASGGTLTVGTNVVATTVADVLKSLLN